MEVHEILEEIKYNRGRFARKAVQAAIEKPDEITPHLLRILEQTIEHVQEIAEEFDEDGELIHRKVTVKRMPPDTAAAFIWLKNRRPKEWRDRRDVKVEADETVSTFLGKLADAEAKGAA